MSAMFVDPTMRLFAVCAAILVLKMQMTVYVITVLRNVRKVYVSPEDYTFWRLAPGEPDEQIERVRRAHQNDLESILPFLAVGFLTAASGAVSYDVARWLFMVFTGARIIHTVAYTLGLQPWRSIAFGVADVSLLSTTVLLLRALL